MTSTLDAVKLAALQPAGPSRAADTSLVTVGDVLDVNADAALVKVSVHESEGSWARAVAGQYKPGGSCLVLLDPFAGGRTAAVLGPVTPSQPMTLATLTAVDEVANRATITWGGGSRVLPFIPSVYDVGTETWVLLDQWGRPVLVLGPSSDEPPPPPPTPTGPPPAAPTAQTQVTIFPQWSGSYRSSRSAWDRWNTSDYGGRSTLYQGDGFGSGPMKGLATYGDQLVNLGAVSIDRMRVRTRGVGLSGASGPAVLQSSPHGSQPGGTPSSSGSTATESGGWAELDATTREEFRTGAKKGLATVGGNYWAIAGAGNGDGMAIDVLYTRPV